MSRVTSSPVLARPIWLVLTYAFAALAWSVAGLQWSQGERALAASLFAGGLSLGPCLAGYLSAPLRYKQLLRRIVLATGGMSILAPLGSATGLELESLFVLLRSGECILCQRCAHACQSQTLRPTLGFDVAGRTDPSTLERSVVPCR